jgi:hypothetical protein
MKIKFNLSRSIAICVILCLLVLACTKSDEKQLEPEFGDFSTIKSDDWKSKIGEEITVDGYLIRVSENFYKIVNDSIYAQANMVLPDKNYILVQTTSGNGSFDTFSKLPDLNGMKVNATGTLTRYQPRDTAGESMTLGEKHMGNKHLATILLKEIPQVLSGKHYEIATIAPGSVLNLATMKALPVNRTKFAFLYSGGIDASQANSWYYNNVQTMYNVLVKQGYPRENIVVVYKHGSTEKITPSTRLTSAPQEYPQIKIDYPATPDGLNSAIDYLKKLMTGKNAELFVMTTNHGGGLLSEKRGEFESGYYGALFDADQDEPTKTTADYDETLFYYNSDKVLTDDEFARKINSLPFVALKGLFLQCYSGGIIHDLRGPNRVLISATRETEMSWGGGSRDLDYFLISFLNPIVLGPNPIHDLNNDGMLQMNEIFIGAKLAQDIAGGLRPLYKMTPQYDDDGDGKNNTPSATGFGSKLTL